MVTEQSLTTTSNNKPVKGGGLTKEQLVAYFKRKYEASDTRSEIVRELYDREDKSLVTETHGQMVLPKVGIKVMLAAIDPNNEKPLLQVWLEAFNDEMISYKRQGRLELLGGLQAIVSAEEEGGSTRV